METTNGHFLSTSFFKRPEAFAGGPGAEIEHRAFPHSTLEQRSRLIHAYFQVLDGMRGPIGVESELPFPKEQIGRAIFDELSDYPECDLRRRLEIAFVLLECFIPLEEYRVIEDFKTASFCAQRIFDTGNPASILRSARIMRKAKGDSAVRLLEKIYENIRKRQVEILHLGQTTAS